MTYLLLVRDDSSFYLLLPNGVGYWPGNVLCTVQFALKVEALETEPLVTRLEREMRITWAMRLGIGALGHWEIEEQCM